jgi:serine/threonine protein kinase
MKGGTLLGQGTYGCVFTPPLVCKTKVKGKEKKVGKVTDEQEALHEITIANHLRKRPFADSYFVLPDPESCSLGTRKSQTEKDLPKCDVLKTSWNETRQIFLRFGGKRAFTSMLLSSDIHPDRFDFYMFMKQLLEIGSTLLLAGTVHFDLHPNNFLVDTEGIVRVIDFGQAFLVADIQRETLGLRWKQLQFGDEKDATSYLVLNSEPPEVTIMNAIRNKYTVEDAIAKTVNGKKVFLDMEKYLQFGRTRSIEELEQFWRTSRAAAKQDWTQMWKLYWTGYDAWAIAALLLQVLKYQLSWPQFVNDEWKQRHIPVYAALKGMLQPNPRKRFDCIEALQVFDPKNEWLQTYGNEWLALRQKQRAAA